MEFVRAIKINRRMCRSIPDCRQCPVTSLRKKYNTTCREVTMNHTREFEEILEQWDKEHPAKTLQYDFFEKFPNAIRDSCGEPKVCAQHCGYVSGCPRDELGNIMSCKDCWDQPMENN